MLLIAVDTSGRKGSVALCRGDAGPFEVLQLSSLEGGMYSAQLMPAIAQALVQNRLSKTDVDGFVVVSGPGSFTGLRVGLSTVKGLCEVLGKPLVAVSMLEAIAVTHGQSGQTVTALLDAGRSEAFAGEYCVSHGNVELLREQIVKVQALVTDVATTPQPILTPDPKLAETLQAAGAQVLLIPIVQADEIARIGLRKLLAGDTSDPATLDANYIRRSDAELFSTPKH